MTTERAARYLGVPAAARYLGVSVRTFYDHVRKELPCVKIGSRVTFDAVDLDAWADAHKERPNSAASKPSDETPLAVPTPTAQRRWALDSAGKLRRNDDPAPSKRSLQERLARLRAQK